MDAKDKIAFINSVGTESTEINDSTCMGEEVVFCTECGTSNLKSANFCENCGNRLQQDVVSDQVSTDTQTSDSKSHNKQQKNRVYTLYQDIQVTPRNKRYVSEISGMKIDKIIQNMEDNQLATIKLAESLDTRKAIATGLPEWSLEPPMELVRRRR